MPSILVVEDDRVARLSLTMFLSMSGYSVHQAADGESAATLLSSMPFDLVISDLHLPGKLNGVDILDLAKRSPHEPAAILISAYGSEEAKERAAVLGAVYMDKPIQFKQIVRIIEDNLYPRSVNTLFPHPVAATESPHLSCGNTAVLVFSNPKRNFENSTPGLHQFPMNNLIAPSPSLNNVLTTDELSTRPTRPPDFEAVNQAFVSLLTAGLRAPESILQRYAELLLALCDAHSSGVSILEIANGEEIFRWHAIAGLYGPYRWGTMPRYASPCGVILNTKAAQLFQYPDRHFPYSIPLDPPICEALLTPFRINGGDVIGTTWVIAHDVTRKFDREDLRRMQTLARFTSISYDLAVER